jgi:hypothetical protein
LVYSCILSALKVFSRAIGKRPSGIRAKDDPTARH